MKIKEASQILTNFSRKVRPLTPANVNNVFSLLEVEEKVQVKTAIKELQSSGGLKGNERFFFIGKHLL